jgi:hypothetical protein
MTLGRPDEAFLVSEQADGAIILEPAVTLPALQAKLLANADLQERLTRAHQGTGLVRRTGRRVPKA